MRLQFLDAFPRVKLIDRPTPLERLRRYGQLIGHNHVYIKRDDVMAIGMGGNKLRNLEFWLGEALVQKCDVVIAGGMEQSNQCRLTAAAAPKVGLECILVHNCDRPSFYQGNMLLNYLAGAKLVFVGPVDENERTIKMSSIARELESQGRKPYVIGDPVLGALGYVDAALEVYNQVRALNAPVRHVVIAGAMGPTAAGFVFGTACLRNPFHVHIISVEYPKAKFKDSIHEIADGICRLTGENPAENIEDVMTIYDQFLGPGYAIPTPESLQTVRDMARLEGVFLETVYTSKTVWGMRRLVEREIIPRDEGVCYVHTGGVPTLFAEAALFQPDATHI